MLWKLFKKYRQNKRITSASSRTVDSISLCADNDRKSSKLCSRCAAIDFSALSSNLLREIEVGLLSTWKPRECEVCDFFLRSLGSANVFSKSDQLFDLRNKDYRSSGFDSEYARVCRDLGIVNYSAVLPANNTFFALERHGFPQRYIVGSSLDLGSMINITSSKVDWHLVNKWLRTDTENAHCVVQEASSCSSTGISLSPPPEKSSQLTVIDCQSGELVKIPPGTEYVTLSYVWGSGCAAFESDRAAGTTGSLRTLPLTVEDSLLVCLNLGNRYLWVDRYCISQTDSEERHRLIQKMDEVYASSILTIVACAGQDPRYGLPGVTRPRSGLPGILVKHPLDKASWYLQALPMTKDIRQSVWAKRGWTYQEAVLSQRKLYFTDHQLYFEGFQAVHCEWAVWCPSKAADEVPSIFPQLKHHAPHEEIYLCIANYSGRELSFESDALNAILGIFAVFEQRHQMRHIWGMPYMSVCEGHDTLDNTKKPSMWYSLGFETLYGAIRRKAFPSWSWLGWNEVQSWPSWWLLINDAAYVLNIQPELVSGSIISWSDYENNYSGHARYDSQLSRFIHIQAHMSSIVSFVWRSIELADGTMLYSANPADHLKYLERVKRYPNKFLLIHMPLHYRSPARYRHLLVEDCGDHWERVAMLTAYCGSKEKSKEVNRAHYHDSRQGPFGILRTIRLG